jgi:hypothetical protein
MYQSIFYSINQKNSEVEYCLEKEEISIWNRKMFDLLYHDVKNRRIEYMNSANIWLTR